MSLNPHSIMAYSPNPLERKVILGHLLACGLRLSLLLSGFAVRVKDTSAGLAVLAHEQRHVDIATTTLLITACDVLVEHVFQLVVFETNRPAHQLVVVIVLGVVGPSDENGVILRIAHIKLISVIKSVRVVMYIAHMLIAIVRLRL